MRVTVCILLALLGATPRSLAKPTKMEIVAYAKDCVERKIRIDLIAKFGTDYRGLDLKAIDLRGFNVNHETILRGADFSDADLEGAILTGAMLDGAKFTGAKCKGSFLGSCSMVGAQLDG